MGTSSGFSICHQKNVLVQWQRDRSLEFCDCFWAHKDQSRQKVALSSGKPVPSKFQLKIPGRQMDGEVGIAFNGKSAKNPFLAASAISSADYVPIKDVDRVGASDPMTALLVYVGVPAQRPCSSLRRGIYF